MSEKLGLSHFISFFIMEVIEDNFMLSIDNYFS
ncbi:hypothetical protein Xmir_01896 [Xenorhabdus miraniensis]|uniref:Uncharacterized protein n=1 Tax=Xenorhabdus miraniensis TaxID=351674 RepID=A0A2D0JR34_9GAMM|nr:hypothetical protein Xmir_01896 [Xenorhabdus miraniensis]